MTLFRWAAGGVAVISLVAALSVSIASPARGQATQAPPTDNNIVIPHAPYPVSARARALHATIPVADLHADPLLSNRDLTKRGTHLDTWTFRDYGRRPASRCRISHGRDEIAEGTTTTSKPRRTLPTT